MTNALTLAVRGGLVVDGTESPLFQADVGITDNRIASVGRVTDRGVDKIDARGLLVTPGFVDSHTHYDVQK